MEDVSHLFRYAEQVPQRLDPRRQWIGNSNEEPQWSDLWELFLHQCTITDAAYAAVPHVVRELSRVEPRKRFDYLVELAVLNRPVKGMPHRWHCADLADSPGPPCGFSPDAVCCDDFV